MGEGKGLAIAALALGIVGLFTAGGLVLGSLCGVGLSILVLVDRTRAGRDVAWAALGANVLALLTIFPLAAAIWAYSTSPEAFRAADDDALPQPVGWGAAGGPITPYPVEIQPPPPPPPPSPTPQAAQRERARVAAEAEPGPAGPVRIGDGIVEPRKTRNVNPVYPAAALAARVQGAVILECTISAEGKVVAVRTLRSVPLLDQAAIDAVKQWEYTPTRLNGVPVPVIMTVTVNFRLS